MKLRSKFLICFMSLIFVVGIITLTGCSSVPPEQSGSSIPWNEPASWENSGFKPGVGF